MSGRRLMDFSDEELKAEFNRLGTGAAIAREIGCTRQAVCRRLKKMGCKLRKGGGIRNRSKFMLVPDEELLAAFRRLGVVDAVRKEYRTCARKVRYRLESLGVDLNVRRPRSRFMLAPDEEILAAYRRLRTADALRREYRASPNSVNARLKSLGVRLKHTGRPPMMGRVKR